MINIIVAFDDNQLIGNNGVLPWHFKEDLSYFKTVTMGHTVLMGRVTYDSIIKQLGHPLKGRNNVVLSRQNLNLKGAIVIHNLEKFLETIGDEELFIIGGAHVYRQCLPYAKRLYITHVEGEYHGDTYFPPIDWKAYQCIKETKQDQLTFAVYERIDG